MQEENPFLSFTDADLSAALLRAIRNIGIMALVGLVIIWIASGWQSAALFLVGAAISAGGIYESRRLIRVVNAKLDNQRSPRSTGFVIAMFLLRLLIAGALLYASLKCLHGAVYAIVAGLALAMIALSIEAVMLTRS
jgi:ATP synthase I chain